MKRLAVVFFPLVLFALACGEAGDVQTPLPPALEDTVQAVVAETQTANETFAESDLEGTITARVQATVRALLNATPIPSPTPTGTIPNHTPRPTIFTTIIGGAFNTAPASTPTLTPAPAPTSTPRATPRPTQLAPCSPAADGAVVSAWVKGIQAASAPVISGSYILLVEQPTGASFTGELITFRVGNSQAKQTVRWTQGDATELVLSAPGDGLSRLKPAGLGGGPLAQPLPPHVLLGTVFVGDC